MSDYKFEKVIIAYTVEELLEQLEDVSDEILFRTKGKLWAGVSGFVTKTETFTDAFDRTDYQRVIYEPVHEGGEPRFMLRFQNNEPAGYKLITTAGELKQYLRESVPSDCEVVSVDDNFELGGSITENIKLVILKNENGRILEL